MGEEERRATLWDLNTLEDIELEGDTHFRVDLRHEDLAPQAAVLCIVSLA